jgi:anti-sigma regulatory factor (Ser/Thr protein kinase)
MVFKKDGTIELNFDNINTNIKYFNDDNFANTEISWSDPIGIVMLKAHSDFMRVSKNIPMNTYMQKMMISDISTRSTTYTPIVQIDNRGEIEKIRNSLSSTIMQNFSNLTPNEHSDLKQYLNHIFSELMNNVSDHAYSPIGGYAMAQYYTGNKKVQFAIADKGCGFLNNIKLKYPEITTEKDAILKALGKAVTASKSHMYGQNRNAGYGLYTLETIINETKGRMLIISNDAMIKIENNKRYDYILPISWGGVAVAIEFFEEQANYEFSTITKKWLVDDEDNFF